MRIARRIGVFCLSFSLVAYAQGNSFKRIRYRGGTIESKVDPEEWDNRLTVSGELIKLELDDGKVIEIDPASVTGLSYGQEAHRRVGTMVALGILVAPLALFGLFHKTRLHYVGVQFKDAEGNSQGMLLQAHKDNYRTVILALQGATDVPVSVGEEERKYLAAGTRVAHPEQAAQAGEEVEAKSEAGIVRVTAEPEGAEIWVDGAFVGNAPAKLSLPPGVHEVKVTRDGYRPWLREMQVMAGSETSLTASLNEMASSPTALELCQEIVNALEKVNAAIAADADEATVKQYLESTEAAMNAFKETEYPKSLPRFTESVSQARASFEAVISVPSMKGELLKGARGLLEDAKKYMGNYEKTGEEIPRE